MRYLRTYRSAPVLFLLLFVIVCGGAAGWSAPSARSPKPPTAGGPVRLRLKIDRTTLESGQATKMWVEFLDGDYNKVANDGTRDVKFEVEPRGSGSFSPKPTVTVKPGEWSSAPPYTIFAPERQGRVLVRVSSEGLDSDETFVLVTRPTASLLTQILEFFEPVAHAQAPQGLKFLTTSLKTQAGTQAKFQLDFGSMPVGKEIQIFTKPPAKIFDENNKEHGYQIKITREHQEEQYSKEIFVFSPDDREVKVFANALPRGAQDSALFTFTKIRPTKISVSFDKEYIAPNWTEVGVKIQLTDTNEKKPLKPDGKRKILLRPGNRDAGFEAKSLEFSPEQEFASTMISLKVPFSGHELAVVAESEDDNTLEPDRESIFIRSPVKKLRVDGQALVKRGSTLAEFTVSLLGDDNTPTISDKNRTVNLSATGGRFVSPNPVTIPKNQPSTTVQYVPSYASGNVRLRAQSDSLEDGTKDIVLVTPLTWLVLAAVLGGLIGGFARHLPNGDGLGDWVPFLRRGSQRFVVNILGSVISGFIFFLAIKLGLSGALGLTLPFDPGMGIAAFFLACLGGYMGIGRVFNGITSLWSWFWKKDVPVAPTAPSH